MESKRFNKGQKWKIIGDKRPRFSHLHLAVPLLRMLKLASLKLCRVRSPGTNKQARMLR